MLLRLATVVLCLSAVSSGLPAAIKRDIVLRDAKLEPGTITMMSESLDYVKPREADAKADPEEDLLMMSESLDYVKPVRREADAKAEPDHMSAMSESLDFVKVAS